MAKWTRELIIREILRREAEGLTLTSRINRDIGHALYQAAARIFGSWRNAVIAAGIAPKRAQVHERWPPGKILSVIRSLARRGRALRPGELKARHGYLLRAARRCFGSWSKAVIAAGIDPLKLRPVAPWTRERIIEGILTRALNNEPLGSRTVRPRSLADAGGKLFGTWRLALTAAGLDPEPFLRPTVDCRRTTSGNTGAAASLGIRPMRKKERIPAGQPLRPRWSDLKVIEAIQTRLREHRALNAKAVYREDRSLYGAATKRHRNWTNALRVAGLNPEEFRKYPSRLGKQSQIDCSADCETDTSSQSVVESPSDISRAE